MSKLSFYQISFYQIAGFEISIESAKATETKIKKQLT